MWVSCDTAGSGKFVLLSKQKGTDFMIDYGVRYTMFAHCHYLLSSYIFV